MDKNIWTKIGQFILDNRKTLLIIAITIILMIALIVLFNPVKNKITELLSKKEVKELQQENNKLRILNQQQIDTALFYKNLADTYSKGIDSSKQQTIIIKQQTHEEVNNIRFAPVDSNIIKFKSDLEEYLSTRK